MAKVMASLTLRFMISTVTTNNIFFQVKITPDGSTELKSFQLMLVIYRLFWHF